MNVEAVQYLNPHSCETMWLKFVETASNDVEEYSEEVMKMLRNMMYSFSEDSLSRSASLLESSQVWKDCHKLRCWFQSKWLPNAKVPPT